MFRKLLFTVALLGITGAVQAADKLQWPTGAQDAKDARVVAFYNDQCAAWADDNKLTGAAREGYIAKCLKEIPDLLPVGYDKPDPDAG